MFHSRKIKNGFMSTREKEIERQERLHKENTAPADWKVFKDKLDSLTSENKLVCHWGTHTHEIKKNEDGVLGFLNIVYRNCPKKSVGHFPFINKIDFEKNQSMYHYFVGPHKGAFINAFKIQDINY